MVEAVIAIIEMVVKVVVVGETPKAKDVREAEVVVEDEEESAEQRIIHQHKNQE